MKKTYLGINVSHGASATLMINGTIKIAIQEERFNKIKNFTGYPKRSIDFCLNYAKKNNLSIDHAAFSSTKNSIFPFKFPIEHFYNIDDWFDHYGDKFYSKKLSKGNIKKYLNKINKDKRNTADLYLPYKNVKSKDYFNNYILFRNIQKKFLLKQSKGLIKKVSFIDHHTCHAYYAYFSSLIKEKKFGVVTLDSEGDGVNQTFWILDKEKKLLKKINESSECDLARIYRFITVILKMKPNLHEYKVMGLAPYAKKNFSMEVYNDVFKKILKVKSCKVVHNNRPKNLFSYLLKKTNKYRFDNIAGAVQILVENISAELFYQIYKKYKITNFALSGGVSMNIKMNKKLSELKFLKKLYVSPCGTDDSLSIGACYFLSKQESPKLLKNIYLGQNLYENNINLKLLKSKFNLRHFKVQKNISSKYVATMLSKGSIIAVARGREEFGARALGNRSILANPSKFNVVQEINEMIKNRDFWMPFALTILFEKHKKFIKNPKNIMSEFMTIGFDTVSKNYNKIKSGTHPYDKSVRPQILKKEYNKNYHSLIYNFEKITRIPALLNTSLNLHGYPISSDLNDVIKTFKNSGLIHLYLDDNFLISKKF